MSRRLPFEPIGFVTYLESTEDYPTANDQLFRCTSAGIHKVPVPSKRVNNYALAPVAEV